MSRTAYQAIHFHGMASAIRGPDFVGPPRQSEALHVLRTLRDSALIRARFFGVAPALARFDVSYGCCSGCNPARLAKQMIRPSNTRTDSASRVIKASAIARGEFRPRIIKQDLPRHSRTSPPSSSVQSHRETIVDHLISLIIC